MQQEIRVRMAPSPTGHLHIGNIRTAIFNWLFARKNKATFILRIEDTDKERSKMEFEEELIGDLKWLGLGWDEFYRQSDRTQIYSKYIQKLLDTGKAFWCYHTPEELEKETKKQVETKMVPRHICDYKTKKKGQKGDGVIRLAVDSESDRRIVFDDMIRGKIEFEASLLGDISIARSPDDALYHLAVVVDDYEMSISHIIRGEDHLSNTPKHILIQEALGFDSVVYAHIPLILAPDRSKLSKRNGNVSISYYKEGGYMPEALFNYLAFLGFTPPGDREVLDKEKIMDVFDLAHVHKSGAIFDLKKLDWFNAEYIKELPDKKLATLLGPYIEKNFGVIDLEYLEKTLPLMRERLKKFSDVTDFRYFFGDIEYEPSLLNWKSYSAEDLKKSLMKIKEIIRISALKDKEDIREQFEELAKEKGDRGLVYWPFRVAITGAKASPDPIDIAFVLGDVKVLARITKAVKSL